MNKVIPDIESLRPLTLEQRKQCYEKEEYPSKYLTGIIKTSVKLASFGKDAVEVISFELMEQYIVMLLYWSSCYGVILETRPKPSQYDVLANDSVEYFLSKAILWPGRSCYYDWEAFYSYELLLEKWGSVGAFAGQAIEGWMKMINQLMSNSDGFSAGGAIEHAVLESSPAILGAYMDQRREGKKSPAHKVMEKSTLLWEADHWPAISLVQKLKESKEPYSKMSAERYDNLKRTFLGVDETRKYLSTYAGGRVRPAVSHHVPCRRYVPALGRRGRLLESETKTR